MTPSAPEPTKQTLPSFLNDTRSRLSNAEYDLGIRLLKEAGLPVECACARHDGLSEIMATTDPEVVTRIEATPCVHDEIRLNQHYVLAGLGVRDLKHRWETFDHPPHEETIRAYSENLGELITDGVGLTFVGRMGTGKTSAATFIARQAIELWGSRSVTVTPFPKAVSAYGEPRLASRLESSRLLVIDEVLIGRSERQKELFDDRMSEFAVSRYQNQRATLITANYTEDELSAAYPRMMSRLAETNMPLVYIGTDYRAASRRTALNRVVSADR